MVWIYCNVLHWLTQIMVRLTSSGMSMPIMEKVTPSTRQARSNGIRIWWTTCLYGYAFPLKCTGGLMYLSILDKPTDEELV